MNDILGVSGLQSFGNLPRNVDRLIYLYGTTSNSVGQRFTFDEFEDKKPRVVCFLQIIDRGDVRMIERS
jgi:hypothetical protein